MLHTLKLKYNIIVIPFIKIRNNLRKIISIKTVVCHTHPRVTVDDQCITSIALVYTHKVSDRFSDISLWLSITLCLTFQQ